MIKCRRITYPPWNERFSHLKMDGWNTFSFPFGKLIFQGRTVSFGRVFFLLYAKVGQDSSRKKTRNWGIASGWANISAMMRRSCATMGFVWVCEDCFKVIPLMERIRLTSWYVVYGFFTCQVVQDFFHQRYYWAKLWRPFTAGHSPQMPKQFRLRNYSHLSS